MIAIHTFVFSSLKKTVLFFVLFFLFIGRVFSQTDDKFYIQFTDKNNSPFSIQQPQLYLSQKSID